MLALGRVLAVFVLGGVLSVFVLGGVLAVLAGVVAVVTLSRVLAVFVLDCGRVAGGELTASMLGGVLTWGGMLIVGMLVVGGVEGGLLVGVGMPGQGDCCVAAAPDDWQSMWGRGSWQLTWQGVTCRTGKDEAQSLQ